MLFWTLAFTFGVCFTHTLARLPPLSGLFITCLILGCLYGASCYLNTKTWTRWIIASLFAVSLGITWTTWYAQRILAWELPKNLEGKTIIVRGHVASLPANNEKRVQFIFTISQFIQPDIKLQQPVRVRLSWYQDYPELQVGQQWQLALRLKRPHSFYNPGGFDFTAWLMQQRIRAVGYVYPDEANQLLNGFAWPHSINRWRQRLAESIAAALPDNDTTGLIQALTVGVKSNITAEQWQTLRQTGTAHLMAISGLHIGLIAGVGYWIVRRLWRYTGGLCLWLPAPKAAALFGLLLAAVYSALAGFALPTQRALIMVAVAALALLMNRKILSWHLWGIALLIVLAVNPLNPLSAGFWLSFGAVALLIYGMQGRLKPKGWWWRWGRAQLVVGLGLFPLSLLWFQQGTLLSLPANLIAIPWVGLSVVPVSLLASILISIIPDLSYWLFKLAALSLAVLWWLLAQLQHLDLGYWQQALPHYWLLLPTVIGIGLLLAPIGLPRRWLGVFWLLPLLRWQPASPAPGDIWFTLLDVGQGLSAVVQTHQHTLVYDTGNFFSARSDAGSSIITPYLRYQGIQHIDRLVISHEHLDHYGGADSLLEQFNITEVLTSFPEKFSHHSTRLCQAGQSWQWNEVRFKVLYPLAEQQLTQLKVNDRSCVIQIDNGQYRVLLTGDIERAAERRLILEYSDKLRSDILQVPHHGSLTSSTHGFIQATQPYYAVIPVGYQNRYGLPHPKVMKRYQQANSQTYDSANCGAITIKLSANKGESEVICYREDRKRYWH